MRKPGTSIDGGANYLQIASLKDAEIVNIYPLPNFQSNGKLLALLADGALFTSVDRGDTWSRVRWSSFLVPIS